MKRVVITFEIVESGVVKQGDITVDGLIPAQHLPYPEEQIGAHVGNWAPGTWMRPVRREVGVDDKEDS